MSGAVGSTGWMAPSTLQYSPLGLSVVVAAINTAERTLAPVVGRPMESAVNVMLASCSQAWAAERTEATGSAAGCGADSGVGSLHATSNPMPEQQRHSTSVLWTKDEDILIVFVPGFVAGVALRLTQVRLLQQ